jgi:hypothetical protein
MANPLVSIPGIPVPVGLNNSTSYLGSIVGGAQKINEKADYASTGVR